MKRLCYFLAAATLLTACQTEQQQTDTQTATAETQAAAPQVEVLFDGSSTDAWRNYNADTISNQWQIQDGTLTMAGKGGGDIITKNEYENFLLELEWKISENGNSGIFFHVTENDTLPAAYFTGPEMQILHNEGHPDGQIEMHRAGDNYDLQACSVETVKGPGEWNAVKLKVDQGKVEHWLNGTKVVEYELGSDAWKAQLAKSKFADWPLYGRAGKGHIALQDHGDPVWFRNIKVTVL
ncbi:MAG: DUF1080 domain-containing protein [Bacteroidota bacterium]